MSLADEVHGVFASLMGYDEHDQQLSIWCHIQRSAAAERWQDWHARNRQHRRDYERVRSRLRRPTIKARKVTAGECRRCTNAAVEGKRSCVEHLAKDRERKAAPAAKEAA